MRHGQTWCWYTCQANYSPNHRLHVLLLFQSGCFSSCSSCPGELQSAPDRHWMYRFLSWFKTWHFQAKIPSLDWPLEAKLIQVCASVFFHLCCFHQRLWAVDLYGLLKPCVGSMDFTGVFPKVRLWLCARARNRTQISHAGSYTINELLLAAIVWFSLLQAQPSGL